jgi:hypothetical protein
MDCDTTAWYRRPQYLVIAVLAIVYVAMLGRYRAFDLDNSWYLSFSYGQVIRHIPADTFALEVFPHGMGGTVAFGKLAALVQGTVLNLFGWSLTHAILISIAFALISLVLFAQTCHRLGYSDSFNACFITLLGLLDPFLAVSQKGRYEFLSVFLLAFALWLGARQLIFLSAFVAALGTEIQPAAIAIFVATGTFLIFQNLQTRRLRLPSLLLRFLLAGLAAATVYFLLHPDIVAVLRSANWHTFGAGGLNFPGGFVAYYLVSRRHLPELALLLVAIVLSLLGKQFSALRDWPFLCFIAVLVVSSALRWANAAYFVFATPFLCLFVLQVFYRERYRNWILAAILLYTVPQIGYRAYIWTVRYPGLSASDQRQVRDTIDRLAASSGVPPETLNVVGNFSLWFAHPSRFISLSTNTVTPPILQNADLILCFTERVDPIVSAALSIEIPCGKLNAIPTRQATTLNLKGHELHLLIPGASRLRPQD